MHDELDNSDIDAAERINDALDAIAQGASPAFHLRQLDDATVRTIDHLQNLSSHAGAPVPAEAFVNQLREDLMLTPHTSLPAIAAKPTASSNKTMRRFIRTESQGVLADKRLPRLPLWGAVEAAAAVLLVIVLVGTLLYGQRQLPPASTSNQYALAPQPSSSAMLAAVSTPEASPAALSIAITITDNGFNPNTIDVEPQRSKMMNFIVHNEGTTMHSLTIPRLGIDVDIAPGGTARVPVQLHPGVSAFYSTAPGDITAGLTGTLTVPVGVGSTITPTVDGTITAHRQLRVADGTVPMRSRPDPSSREITTLTPGVTVTAVSAIDPSSATPTIVEIDGIEWILVQIESGDVGWIIRSDVEPFTPANATPVSSPVAIPGSSSTLSPNSIPLTIKVDLNGVLRGDPVAVDKARAELDRVLAPYINGSSCQIGFALITSRSETIEDGLKLSNAISKMIRTTYPNLLAKSINGEPPLVSESFAMPGTTPVGEVQLQLFLNLGCRPAPATPVATPVAP